MDEVNPLMIKEIIGRWDGRKDCLVEILHDIQEEYNYLPKDALTELSKLLQVPLSEIVGIATFYKAFSLKPRGRFGIGVCMGTACHVQGADMILEAFERELEVTVGNMDEKEDFSLDIVRCLGCCGLAPVVSVNREIYGNFTPDQVPNIVEKYRSIPRKKVDINKKYKEIKEKLKAEEG